MVLNPPCLAMGRAEKPVKKLPVREMSHSRVRVICIAPWWSVLVRLARLGGSAGVGSNVYGCREHLFVHRRIGESADVTL